MLACLHKPLVDHSIQRVNPGEQVIFASLDDLVDGNVEINVVGATVGVSFLKKCEAALRTTLRQPTTVATSLAASYVSPIFP